MQTLWVVTIIVFRFLKVFWFRHGGTVTWSWNKKGGKKKFGSKDEETKAYILFTVGETFVTFRVFHGRMGFLEQYPGARTIVDVLSCIQTGVGLIHQEKNWT